MVITTNNASSGKDARVPKHAGKSVTICGQASLDQPASLMRRNSVRVMLVQSACTTVRAMSSAGARIATITVSRLARGRISPRQLRADTCGEVTSLNL